MGLRGDYSTVSRTHQIPTQVPDNNVEVPEPCNPSDSAAEGSFDLSRDAKGHIHEIDAPSRVASRYTTPEDHVYLLADNSPGRSDGLSSGDSRPESGSDLNDGIVTVDCSPYIARVSLYVGFKVTLPYVVIALLDPGSPQSFTLESA